MVQPAQFRNSFLIGLLAFLIVDCSGELERMDVDQEHEDLTKIKGVYFYGDEPFNGRIIAYYENGDTASTAEYTDGIKKGISRKWYQGGQLKFEGNYTDGLYHGAVAEWYPNGARYSLFNYELGKEVGRQQAWLENGKFKANYEVIGDRKYGLTGVKNCSNDWEK